MSAKKENTPFEHLLTELEGIVRKLESGELTLDDSLAHFEKGISLARACETKLEEAKGTIEKLIVTASGGEKNLPF